MSLEVLLASLSALAGIISSFSLGASPTGMVIEVKACSKLWEATLSSGTSAALSEDFSLGASVSFICYCWLGQGGSRGCISLTGLAIVEATSP